MTVVAMVYGDQTSKNRASAEVLGTDKAECPKSDPVPGGLRNFAPLRGLFIWRNQSPFRLSRVRSS